MSVRATSHPIGAATTPQTIAELVARMSVVTRGSRKLGSVTSWAKLASVKPPVRSRKL
jgi:hypothetical protein